MNTKAYIVFWVDMSKGGCVVSTGVYSEPSPTMYSADVIPVIYSVTHGEDYGDASEQGKRLLASLQGRFPKLPTGDPPEADRQDNHPTFYCGRCRQHIDHNCPATYPDPTCG